MNLSENYYAVLGLTKIATQKEIKKSYYRLSFEHHPDKGGDPVVFGKMTEAYDVLMDDVTKKEYDSKSKWGINYDESLELLDYEFNNNAKAYDEKSYEEFKKNSVLNIVIHIDETFDGSVEYERWVLCKKCKGSGKDLDSKIQIKDNAGNILKIFDGSDGCDFCEGTGKSWKGENCGFCGGQGKVGSSDCQTCDGERRILGKQKLKGIVFPKDEKEHKIESMGNSAKDASGKSGHVYLIRDNFESDSDPS
jgi:DnaJ-class molecular chaperone